MTWKETKKKSIVPVATDVVINGKHGGHRNDDFHIANGNLLALFVKRFWQQKIVLCPSVDN